MDPPPGRVICRAFHILVCIWFPIKLEFHPVRVKIFTRRRGGREKRETMDLSGHDAHVRAFYILSILVCI